MADMTQAASDEALTKIRDFSRELSEYTDAYLKRRNWPGAVMDEVNGIVAEIQAWIDVIEATDGLANYDAEG